MNKLTTTPTALAGVFKVERSVMSDERGFFSRLFCSDELRTVGWNNNINQINHSITNRVGSVRGFHFQLPPHAEMKRISCIRGKVLDIALDLRTGSPTFLHHVAVELSANKGEALLLPEGVAHGFQVLEEHSELIYCHSHAYHPEFERGINPLDPKVNICWPLPITDISAKDRLRPMLPENYCGVEI